MTSRGGANILLLTQIYSRSINTRLSKIRSHGTVSKFAYVSIFTYVSNSVHVNCRKTPSSIPKGYFFTILYKRCTKNTHLVLPKVAIHPTKITLEKMKMLLIYFHPYQKNGTLGLWSTCSIFHFIKTRE